MMSAQKPLTVGEFVPIGGEDVPIVSITQVFGQDVDAEIELQGD